MSFNLSSSFEGVVAVINIPIKKIRLVVLSKLYLGVFAEPGLEHTAQKVSKGL